MLHVRRDQDALVHVQVRQLAADPDAGGALDHEIQLVGGRVVPPLLFLFRLEADEVGDQAWTVDEIEAVWPLPREPAGLSKSNDFHVAF